MERDEFITLREAESEYGWSRPMLYKFRKQQKLTFYVVPGRRHTLLKRSELDALRTPRAKG